MSRCGAAPRPCGRAAEDVDECCLLANGPVFDASLETLCDVTVTDADRPKMFSPRRLSSLAVGASKTREPSRQCVRFGAVRSE